MTTTTELLLPPIQIDTAPDPRHVVIWMHGLGADGNDFVPIIGELKLSAVAVRFIFPHAPARPVTINSGYVMRAWYDIGYEDLSLKEDEKGVRASQKAIEGLMEREIARGVPHQQIVLAGFSQGGAIALQTGLRYPHALGGIIALSTYLPLPDKIEAERHSASHSTPIFMAHGTEDPIVPLKLAQASCSRLINLGYSVQWHEYDMPHSVCPEEVEHIGAFLRERFID